jgi:hypothetical protein
MSIPGVGVDRGPAIIALGDPRARQPVRRRSPARRSWSPRWLEANKGDNPPPEALAQPSRVAKPVIIMAISCTGTTKKMILWQSLNI